MKAISILPIRRIFLCHYDAIPSIAAIFVVFRNGIFGIPLQPHLMIFYVSSYNSWTYGEISLFARIKCMENNGKKIILVRFLFHY